MKKIHLGKDYLIEKIQNVRLFLYLSDEQKKDFLSRVNIIEYEMDEKIVAQGDLSHELYIIIDGMTSVMVSRENGKEVYIGAVGEGEVIGEAALFMNVERTANVVATGRVVALSIERKEFIGFINQHNRAGIKIMMMIIYSLLKKLRDSNQELAFERKGNINQNDIDSIVEQFLSGEVPED